MPESIEELCRDINRVAAYLAQDDFSGGTVAGPGTGVLVELDVVVLLGNRVIATLEAACSLMQRAPAARILFSGGLGRATSHLFDNLCHSSFGPLVDQGIILESMTEAEMYAAVARHAFRIPQDRILIEDRSSNTGENARFSLQILKDALPRSGSILILQDPVMQRRSMLTWAREAEIVGSHLRARSHAVFVPRVEPGPAATLRFLDGQSQGTWTQERFLALLLGEIERIHDDENGYGPKGSNFLPHVEIPEEVYESYLRVRDNFQKTLRLG
jgi:uncharacterized SAM-binding protein YcdF (DUF218 family)